MNKFRGFTLNQNWILCLIQIEEYALYKKKKKGGDRMIGDSLSLSNFIKEKLLKKKILKIYIKKNGIENN